MSTNTPINTLTVKSDESPYAVCSQCGEYDYIPDHRCPPKFLCWFQDKDYGEKNTSQKVIYAKTPQMAAEKYVEQWDDKAYDFGHYPFASREESVIVCVEVIGMPVMHLMEVRAWMVPKYDAIRIDR